MIFFKSSHATSFIWLCIDFFFNIFTKPVLRFFSSCIIIAESENPQFFFLTGKCK